MLAQLFLGCVTAALEREPLPDLHWPASLIKRQKRERKTPVSRQLSPPCVFAVFIKADEETSALCHTLLRPLTSQTAPTAGTMEQEQMLRRRRQRRREITYFYFTSTFLFFWKNSNLTMETELKRGKMILAREEKRKKAFIL